MPAYAIACSTPPGKVVLISMLCGTSDKYAMAATQIQAPTRATEARWPITLPSPPLITRILHLNLTCR
ncbi:MAG: hypothetical protein ACJ8DM_22950, partial [Microvirga sp.]